MATQCGFDDPARLCSDYVDGTYCSFKAACGTQHHPVIRRCQSQQSFPLELGPVCGALSPASLPVAAAFVRLVVSLFVCLFFWCVCVFFLWG